MIPNSPLGDDLAGKPPGDNADQDNDDKALVREIHGGLPLVSAVSLTSGSAGCSALSGAGRAIGRASSSPSSRPLAGAAHGVERPYLSLSRRGAKTNIALVLKNALCCWA